MTDSDSSLNNPYTDEELDDLLDSGEISTSITKLHATIIRLRDENKTANKTTLGNKLTVLNATVKHVGEVEKASHNVPCVKLEYVTPSKYVTPSNIPTINQTTTLVLDIKNAKNFHYNQDVIITIEEASND